MASPAQSTLARSPALWELTSPKFREGPVRAASGPSLRPSQGTRDRVTQSTQLVAPTMSFPPPYGRKQPAAAFIRLSHLKPYTGYGDFPEDMATCKYMRSTSPVARRRLLPWTNGRACSRPMTLGQRLRERADDVTATARAPWRLGGGGRGAAYREVPSA